MNSLTLDLAYIAAQRAPGVILFTVSVIADKATTMARVYSSHPEVYPIGGRKKLDGQTAPEWFERVVKGGKPFLGRDVAAVRAFFFDSETIESLGCGAIINVPIRDHGETIGSINFLDEEGKYDESSVPSALEIADGLVGAVRAAALSLEETI